MEKMELSEALKANASVLEELMPEYPKNISYSAKSNGLFYIKITGFSDGIVYYASTGDAGKTSVVLARVDGEPATMRLTNVTDPLVKIKPIAKIGDSALYFSCDGTVGRVFTIKLYGYSKSSIEYTILDSIE